MTVALIVLAVVVAVLAAWNVAIQSHDADDREASARAMDNLVRSVLDDLRVSRRDLTAERAAHVEQLAALLAAQSAERELLITAVLQPDERISLAKLGITSTRDVGLAQARVSHDDLVLARMERGRAEGRFEDIDGS